MVAPGTLSAKSASLINFTNLIMKGHHDEGATFVRFPPFGFRKYLKKPDFQARHGSEKLWWNVGPTPNGYFDCARRLRFSGDRWTSANSTISQPFGSRGCQLVKATQTAHTWYCFGWHHQNLWSLGSDNRTQHIILANWHTPWPYPMNLFWTTINYCMNHHQPLWNVT